MSWFEARIDELLAWSEGRVPDAVLVLALLLAGYAGAVSSTNPRT